MVKPEYHCYPFYDIQLWHYHVSRPSLLRSLFTFGVPSVIRIFLSDFLGWLSFSLGMEEAVKSQVHSFLHWKAIRT